MKLLNRDAFIAREIKYWIMAEKLEAGEKLPSERELSEMFAAQRVTVRSALKMLVLEGIIEARERSGYFMRPQRLEENLRRGSNYRSRENEGRTVSSRLVSFERMEVDKTLSRKVKKPIGYQMYRIVRVRSLSEGDNKIPVSLDYVCVPEETAPRLMRFDLEERTVLEILEEEYGVIPAKNEQRVEIVYANQEEARLLNISLMEPVVKKSSWYYDAQGGLIQYMRSINHKDWVEFIQHNPLIEEKIGVWFHGL